MSKTKKPVTTLVTFLLDRSYSMEHIKDSTIEAFNGYLGALREQKGILFSLVQFDYEHACSLEKTCIAVEASKAPDLSVKNYVPRGGTPLIEAAIKVIEATADKAGKRDQVVICIQTDGEENQSGRDYTWERLRGLIAAKQALGWQFNFMGAGIDAYNQGAKMGLSRGMTMSYDSADATKTRAAFRGRGATTTLYARGAVADMSISNTEKLEAGDKFNLNINASVQANQPSAKPVAPAPNTEQFKL